MKKVFGIAAMMLTLAACNKVETEVQPVENTEGIPFSATISVDNNATTKALAESGSTIVATWAVDETVALIHNGVKDVMTVSAVNEGVATITGTITNSPSDGDAVTVIYPASAADGTTGNIKADLLYAQNGLLTGDGSIAANYDARKGTGTLKVSGMTASLNGNMSLTNEFAIFKFTTKNSDGSATIDVKPLTITIGSQDYVITPASATNILYAALPAISGQAVTFTATGSDSKTYTASKASVTFSAGYYYQSVIKMAPVVSYNQTKSINAGDVTVTAGEHWLITGTGADSNYFITIGDGATVTLDGVKINMGGGNYPCIKCEGSATIILKDGSTNQLVNNSEDYPALWIGNSGTTLTIQGSTGRLTVTSGNYCAGIGGGWKNDSYTCGNIVIEGGIIEATGGSNAGAGIGSDNQGTCGSITISGGTVTGMGQGGGAGIGSGYGSASCGNIIISGGTVIAVSNGAGGAGIGSGKWSSCADITISGGDITATGGDYAAGIGGGDGYKLGDYGFSSCGNITIENTVTSVTATKGNYGNPESIGAGDSGICGTVSIAAGANVTQN